MRVRYDDQIMVRQRRGGISRYFVELVREFRADPGLGVSVEVDWRASRNEHAVAAGLGRPASRSRRRLTRLAHRLPSVHLRRTDVAHSTYYDPACLPVTPEPPMVVTVHDMIPELLPGLFPSGNPHLAKEDFVRRARAILCVSESTRKDLNEMYGPLEALVEVVPLGVGRDFAPGRPRPHGLPDGFILFMGNRGLYKDFGVAVEAFAAIHASHPDLRLVAAGGGRFKDEELATMRRLSIDGSVHHVEATDPELPGLFGGAQAFVFPSRYEGFGLPTLEAMACGTPVILANSSSHPEVGGDAALFFEPGDASALCAQLVRLLEDTELREALVSRGLERAAGFTWRQTAMRTRDVYTKVAQRG